MNIIGNAVDHINNGQEPVTTFDQPLYTIAKQIQWNWPERFMVKKSLLSCLVVWYSRFLSEGVTYYPQKTCISDDTYLLIHS